MASKTFYRIEGAQCVPVECVQNRPYEWHTPLPGLVLVACEGRNGWSYLNGYSETPEGAWDLAIAAAKDEMDRYFYNAEAAKSRYLELVDASVDA